MRKARSRSRRWIWLPIAITAGAYYAAPRALKKAFAPPQRDSTRSPADLGLPEEQVWLSSVGGKRLHGWFVPTGDVDSAVVVLHGWGGNASLMLPLASHLHAAGFHALFLDARNHGLSEHDRFTSMPRFAEDLEVAVAWLHDHPLVTTVGVIGHSVGAGAAVLSASRGDGLRAVVSVSAPAHPGDMMRIQMNRIPSPIVSVLLEAVQRTIGYRFDDFASRNRIGLVTAPMLLVHGDADQVVGIDNLYELAAAQPNAAVVVVAGGGHSDLDPFLRHVGEITGFLRRHLSPHPPHEGITGG